MRQSYIHIVIYERTFVTYQTFQISNLTSEYTPYTSQKAHTMSYKATYQVYIYIYMYICMCWYSLCQAYIYIYMINIVFQGTMPHSYSVCVPHQLKLYLRISQKIFLRTFDNDSDEIYICIYIYIYIYICVYSVNMLWKKSHSREPHQTSYGYEYYIASYWISFNVISNKQDILEALICVVCYCDLYQQLQFIISGILQNHVHRIFSLLK